MSFSINILPIILLLLAALCSNAQTNLSTFIPEGYKILDTVSGDLNRDGIPDMIMALKSKNEKHRPTNAKPYVRPLLLLLGDANHEYKLAVRNDTMLEYYGFDSLPGNDTYRGMTVKDGTFTIELCEHVDPDSLSEDVGIWTFKFERDKDWHFVSYESFAVNIRETKKEVSRDYKRMMLLTPEQIKIPLFRNFVNW